MKGPCGVLFWWVDKFEFVKIKVGKYKILWQNIIIKIEQETTHELYIYFKM